MSAIRLKTIEKVKLVEKKYVWILFKNTSKKKTYIKHIFADLYIYIFQSNKIIF